MKRLLITILTLSASLCASARSAVNLDSLYQVLDAAIDSADIYLQQKTNRIAALKEDLMRARTDQDKYDCAVRVAAAYVPFVNDSAIAYQYQCIRLARRMGRDDLQAESTIGLAYQLANSGFYNEARIHFDEVPTEQLTEAQLTQYLSGMNHLYGEMGYYSHDPELSKQFFDRANELRQTLLARMDSTTSSWNALRSMILNNEGKSDEALPYSDRWLSACAPASRRFAVMAFFRSEIYKKKDDVEMQRYWLLQAAITDVRNAIMDQGALWSLANSLIRNEGDLDRAYRYMDFSWTCISRFSPHMRSWLVTPVLTKINDQYKNRLETANSRLRWTVALISLLLAGLLLALLYVHKKRQQLSKARDELKRSNGQLSEANGQLSALNAQLSVINRQLSDSNRVKEEYISKFFSICSNYIDKLDAYRLKINRKVKTGQYADIQKLTGSQQMKEDEVKELFVNFDHVFLHLFPTFVSEFNALLKPEHSIPPSEDGSMTTDQRIFALIRLGIDESSRIAEFLRYSPNSIYNYRARLKNKANDRENFEEKVKAIGIA